MNKLQLLYSGLLGIIAAVVAFMVLSMSQLKTELDTVSLQLLNTKEPVVSTTNDSKSNESLDQLNHNKLEILVNSVADLAEKIDFMGLRLDQLDDMQQSLSADMDEKKSLDYPSPDTMAETASAYTPEQPRLSQADSQALLEYALTDSATHDQIWSDNTKIQVEEILTQSASFEIANDFNVTCGGQLCKIKSILPKGTSFMEKEFFDMNLMADLAPIKSRSILQQKTLADGSTEYTHYIARQGYRLPTETPAKHNNINGSNDLE